MYSVRITRKAEKELGKLSYQAQERIVAAMKELADDPRPPGSKKLTGNPMPEMGDEDFYRIRVGDYRVIYTIEEGQLLVLVVRIRHRREAYR